jgi:hypothetical protein
MMLLNVKGFSQNSQTNKDSVKVSIKDMDKSVIKMIEGKEAKEQNKALNSALLACDKAKFELKQSNEVLSVDLSILKKQNTNLVKDATDLKTIVKNEKSRKLRSGFFGFGAGVVLGFVLSFL